MSTRPRQPRRQGVVYGPLTRREQHDPASLLGRLLGVIVIVGALAVLAIGGLAFLGGDDGPSTTATPTLAGVASPTPTRSLAPTPTPTPSPTPSFIATPSPSPSPSPFLVELVEGPGKITFARDYSADFDLIDPRVDFRINEQMAWRANIGDPVGRVRVNFNVYRVDTSTLAETEVHSASFVGSNPNARFFYAKAPVSREADGPGFFVMRYSVDGVTIAEGYFRVIE